MLMFIFFLISWFISFIFLFYYLYLYYIKNKIAFDFWNFYSKNLTYGKVLNEIVFKGLNRNQYEVKAIKLTKIIKHAKRNFWLNDICTCHGLLPSHSA